MVFDKKGIVIALSILVIILLIIRFGTEYSDTKQENNIMTCNSPYIQVGTNCCLDENYNKICDTDEKKESPYHTYEVKVGFSNEYYSNIRDIHIVSYEFGTPIVNEDDKYYYMGYLYFYTYYNAEDLSCEYEEYYDSQLSEKLYINIKSSNGLYSSKIRYSKDDKPKSVRYNVKCTGSQSNIQYATSYIIEPDYP
ncbi:MAG: hypothetical protein Q7R87_03285 [Nanoarchaeota archaeon]|nr:hypothetical protein [Nanoarchaeota archaeon]